MLHLPQCTKDCNYLRQRAQLPLCTFILHPTCHHPFPCQPQRCSWNPRSGADGGDGTKHFIPCIILHNALGVLPVRYAEHYHLLGLLFCTFIITTSPPTGSSGTTDTRSPSPTTGTPPKVTPQTVSYAI